MNQPTSSAAGLLFALLLSSCSGHYAPIRPDSHPYGSPPASVEMDGAGAFKFDPGRQWHLVFRRGGGWQGFDSVILDEAGVAKLERMKESGKRRTEWESAVVHLDALALKTVAQTIGKLQLTKMAALYSAGIEDGTQWEFRLTQAGETKRIWCDNHFPAPIIEIAAVLDRELARCGGDRIRWDRVRR